VSVSPTSQPERSSGIAPSATACQITSRQLLSTTFPDHNLLSL
jgi:hypothetical protein